MYTDDEGSGDEVTSRSGTESAYSVARPAAGLDQTPEEVKEADEDGQEEVTDAEEEEGEIVSPKKVNSRRTKKVNHDAISQANCSADSVLSNAVSGEFAGAT